MQIAQQITIWKLGNPWVQVITTKKKMNRMEPLPGARKEEIRIGKTLQTAPLVATKATKEEVLKRVSTEDRPEEIFHSCFSAHCSTQTNGKRKDCFSAKPHARISNT